MKSTGILLMGFLIAGLFPSPLGAQNPRMVTDLFPGPDSAFFGFRNQLVTREVIGDALYFSADNGVSGQELFVCRPPYEALSTSLVKDMTPGLGGVTRKFESSGSSLFFFSRGTAGTDGFCRSDGSAAGTSALWTMLPKTGQYQYLQEHCAALGSQFVIRRVDNVAGANFCGLTDIKYEVWKVDPQTAAGTILSTQIRYSGLKNVNGIPIWRGTYKGKVTNCSYSGGYALYKTNGTAKGTLAYYILPSGGSVTVPMTNGHPYYSTSNSYPGIQLTAGSKCYFLATDASHGSELYVTDGTTAGSGRLTDINPGPGNADPAMGAVMGDFLYFAANDGTSGYQVWRYPLAGGTAQRVTNIDGAPMGADPMWLTPCGGWLYFSAYSADFGRELWRCNGLPLSDPAAVTEMVMNIRADNNGIASSNPNYASVQEPYPLQAVDSDPKYTLSMTVIGGWVYFPANDGSGFALWRSNGVTTEKLGGGANPRKLTPMLWSENAVQKDVLLYVGWSEASGFELWKFDPAQPPSPKRGEAAAARYELMLEANYPNPFCTRTLLRYQLPEAGFASLAVFDALGRKVATVFSGWASQGSGSAMFDASALPSGMYTCVLESGGISRSRVIVRAD